MLRVSSDGLIKPGAERVRVFLGYSTAPAVAAAAAAAPSPLTSPPSPDKRHRDAEEATGRLQIFIESVGASGFMDARSGLL